MRPASRNRGLSPTIEHTTARSVEIIHPWIWPVGSGLLLETRHGRRCLASESPGSNWDWEALRLALVNGGFETTDRKSILFY